MTELYGYVMYIPTGYYIIYYIGTKITYYSFAIRWHDSDGCFLWYFVLLNKRQQLKQPFWDISLVAVTELHYVGEGKIVTVNKINKK